VGTMTRAAWRGCTDPALKRRLMAGRNAHNGARRHLAWHRRREVYHLWYVWRAQFGPSRGLQALIADSLSPQVSRATICRDFACLGLRRAAAPAGGRT
jgi:hypothetical protein